MLLAELVAASGREVLVLKPELLYYRLIGVEPRNVQSFDVRLAYGVKGAWIASNIARRSSDATVIICDRYVDSVIAVYSSLNDTSGGSRIIPHPSAFPVPETPVLLQCHTETRHARLRARAIGMSARKQRAAFDLADDIERRLARARDWIVVQNDDMSVGAAANLIFRRFAQEEVSVCKRF